MNWLRPRDARGSDSGMGTFRVSIQLARAGLESFEDMEALVDTGASYTWIPRNVLERLGAQPDEERVFVLADGREVRYPIAWVRVKLGDRIQPTLAVFGDIGTEPILGAFTLEGFGLGVDPVNRRLIPVPGLLKQVLRVARYARSLRMTSARSSLKKKEKGLSRGFPCPKGPARRLHAL